MKKYERRKGLQQAQPFYDTRIHKVRSDRQLLDNALAAYQTTWSSLIGQLADLEGVIEETGNDVLKSRCRITLQMVSALEDRLQLATSAIEFCCGELNFFCNKVVRGVGLWSSFIRNLNVLPGRK